jgi:hypothetical protein
MQSRGNKGRRSGGLIAGFGTGSNLPQRRRKCGVSLDRINVALSIEPWDSDGSPLYRHMQPYMEWIMERIGLLAAPGHTVQRTTLAQWCLTCPPGHARRACQGYPLLLTQGLASRLADLVPRRLNWVAEYPLSNDNQLDARRYITAARLAAAIAAVATVKTVAECSTPPNTGPSLPLCGFVLSRARLPRLSPRQTVDPSVASRAPPIRALRPSSLHPCSISHRRRPIDAASFPCSRA